MTDVRAPADSLEPAEMPEPAPGTQDPAPSALRARIYLGLLVTYVVLLAIGVLAEAFHVQWILDWPIY